MERFQKCRGLLKVLFVISQAILLAGCANGMLSTGAQPAGQVANGIYSAPIGSESNLGQFSVRIPTETYGQNNKVPYEQEIHPTYTYVSFRANQPDATVFDLMVGQKPPAPLSDYRTKGLNGLVALRESFYGQPVTKVVERMTTIKGQEAVYAVYTQPVPSGFNSGSSTANATTLTHVIVITYSGDYFVSVSVQANDSQSNPLAVTNSNRKAVAEGHWAPLNTFIAGLTLIPPKKV